MNIEGIPQTIERQKVLDWVASLGIDYTNLISLNLRGKGIEAEMWATDENGRRFFLDGGGELALPGGEDMSFEVARHVVTIPFADEVKA